MNTHYLYAKMALEARKHVYTEKTMTDTWEQACELMELAKKKMESGIIGTLLFHSDSILDQKNNRMIGERRMSIMNGTWKTDRR